MRDLDRFLDEDLGTGGDLTTRLLLGRNHKRAKGRVFARGRMVVAGLLEAKEVFARMRVDATPALVEGEWAHAGATLLEIGGRLDGILTAERLALNIIGRMGGISTSTRRLQKLVSRVNPACRVAATRKTTPGFRAFEKRAVALGGGEPHRYGLYDAILVKDNHADAVGGLDRALRAVMKDAPRGFPVEAEARDMDEAKAAARAGVDWLLLDNMTPRLARSCAAQARRILPRIRIECSGGLNASNIQRYAPFSDRLSLGALTHSAASADVSLELVAAKA